jgi:hypothetical protein
MPMTSARSTRRSTNETTQAALGNTSDHALNALLVVATVLAVPYMRLTRLEQQVGMADQ